MSQEEREQLKQATMQLDAGLSTSAPTAGELVTLQLPVRNPAGQARRKLCIRQILSSND